MKKYILLLQIYTWLIYLTGAVGTTILLQVALLICIIIEKREKSNEKHTK